MSAAYGETLELVCPETHQELVLEGGVYRTPDHTREYAVVDGIPCLVYPPELQTEDSRWMAFYDRLAPLYDFSERWLGKLLTGVDMLKARAEVAELLPICEGESVLEVSPGPGVYQSLLATRVGNTGRLTALDLSQGMLRECARKTRDQLPKPMLVRGNASHLPFRGAFFDGLFHFGGVNLFSEPARALEEFARVVRPGGWVAFGDEGMSNEWLARDDWRPKMLKKMNPGYEREPVTTPRALAVVKDHCVYGGLAYLRVCRVVD